MKILNHCGAVLVFVGLVSAAPYVFLLLQDLSPTKVLLAPFGLSVIGAVLFFSTKLRLNLRKEGDDSEEASGESVREKQHREIETFSQMY